jgi:hypothetical protein
MRWTDHVWGTGEVHAGFWWGNLRDRDNFQRTYAWIVV